MNSIFGFSFFSEFSYLRFFYGNLKPILLTDTHKTGKTFLAEGISLTNNNSGINQDKLNTIEQLK